MLGDLFKKLIESMSPMQVCWVCLIVTAGLAMFSVRTFADNSKVDSLSYKLEAIQAEFLEQRIFETRLRQCTASTTEARQFYGQKLAELATRYQQATTRSYPMPSCSEVQ